MAALGKDFIAALKRRYKQENVIIGGTSAGAMILSGKMIAEGANEVPQVDEKIKIETGLNLLPNFIIDTHFIERGRFARLSHAIKKSPTVMGLGIEADTAVLIENEAIAKLYGCGTVTVIDGSHIKKYKKKPESQCVTNIQVHLLTAGCTFNFEKNCLIEK